MADGIVSVSRHIEAPAERLFALLADSGNHPLIDGSGMVREPAPAVRLSGTGVAFVMNMHHDERGDYVAAAEQPGPGHRRQRDRAHPSAVILRSQL